MIIINIGSENPVKIRAVRETLGDYGFLKPFELNAMHAESGVPEQPKSFKDIVKGAKNRAENAFIVCNYSIGLESGLMEVPFIETYMHVVFCSIYDGDNFYNGLSSGFELPGKVIGLVEKGMNVERAVYEAGLTGNPKIGSSEGIISVFTKDRVRRKDHMKQAIQMALAKLENLHLYRNGPGGI